MISLVDQLNHLRVACIIVRVRKIKDDDLIERFWCAKNEFTLLSCNISNIAGKLVQKLEFVCTFGRYAALPP